MDLRNLLASSQVNPRKILKIVVSLSVVLLVMWLFMVSRMELNNTGGASGPQMVERTDSLRTAIARDSRVSESERSSPNIFMNAFTTFVVLVVILAIVLILMRNRQGQVSDKQLKEVGEHVLGQGAQIKIIEINKEIWVIGVTSSQVNLLHRYPKEGWKVKIDYPDETDKSFYNIFKSKI